MFLSILKSLNWVDIVFIILIIRITYVALSQGFSTEIFKLTGSIFSLFVCLHYYSYLGDTLDSIFRIKIVSIEIWDFLSFVILWIVTGVFFWLLRISVLRLFKVEAISWVNRWFGLLLGLVRAVIVVSMLTYLFSIPVVDYFKKSFQNSYIGRRTFFVSPSLYRGVFNGLVLKFMPQQKINSAVEEIEDELK